MTNEKEILEQIEVLDFEIKTLTPRVHLTRSCAQTIGTLKEMRHGLKLQLRKIKLKNIIEAMP